MARVVLDGRWRVRVVRNYADWPQRVVITGSTSLVIPGRVGESAEVKGKRWALTIEHQQDGVWQENEFIGSQLLAGNGGQEIRQIQSKDRYWPGDDDPNDLVLMVEQVAAPPDFQVVGSPRAVDTWLRPVLSGFCDAQARFLAVDIANSGEEPFGYDAALNISGPGREALARHGVQVLAWSAESERTTRQEVFGRAVSLPQLSPGERVTIYFPVDSSSASGGSADVEFELRHVGGPGGERQVARDVQLAPDKGPARWPAGHGAAGPGLVTSGTQVQVPAAGPYQEASPVPAAAPARSGSAGRNGSGGALPGRSSAQAARLAGRIGRPLGHP